MNTLQKLILLLAIAIVVVMGLFPPWIRTDAFGIPRHRGYAFFLQPPISTADSLLANAPVRYSVDWNHLVKGWLCVAGMAGPVAVLLRTREKNRVPPYGTKN